MNENNKTNWWALIIDKLIIALILVAAIWRLEFYSSNSLQESDQLHQKQMLRLQERIDSLSDKKNQLFQLQFAEFQKKLNDQSELNRMKKQLEDDFQRADRDLENRLAADSANVIYEEKKEISRKKLDYVSRQLSEFYWPVLQRLEKNEAVFSMMGHDVLGTEIANSVVLPNHRALLKLFEEKMHLAQANKELKVQIRKYIAHAHMYEALLKGNYDGFPGGYGGEGYPDTLYYLIRSKTDSLQSRYDTLLYKTKLKESIPILETSNNSFNLSTQELAPFDLKVFSPTIKQSYNDNNFLIYLDQDTESIKLILVKYIWENKICLFEIEDSSNPSNVNNEEFYISQDIPFDYKANNGRVYRIYLLETWKQRMKSNSIRKRTRVSVKVESWMAPVRN